MIARQWRAWASPAGAGEYERYYAEVVVSELEAIEGFAGATLLRRDLAGEVELVSITLFASMDAVRGFAGAEPDRAVVHERARRMLARYEETVAHYRVVVR